MFTEKIEREGKVLRTIEHDEPPAVITLPPYKRSYAAAEKARELMNSDCITLAEAMERPEVLQAARDADLNGPPVGRETGVIQYPDEAKAPAPARVEVAPPAAEITEDVEPDLELYRRYLLSIANQTRTSFDGMSLRKLREMMMHPKFQEMDVLSFQVWAGMVNQLDGE